MNIRLSAAWWLVSLAVVFALATGCQRDALVSPDPFDPAALPDQGVESIDHGGTPPSGIVPVDWNGESLGLWPWSGASFDGTPKDPVNLIFVGPANVLEIRAALMALDGDRTAYGLPAQFPFDGTWADAIGNVQTAYCDEGGWVGSVVQLELGGYAPLRTHLRLWETGMPHAEGTWVVGAAHFELTIPGTPEHQVLSWEVAEYVVKSDLERSGLLATSPVQTGVINDLPTYREIPAAIYNGVPEGLKALIGGPPGDVVDPVPIPSDGRATILALAEAAPIVAGTWTYSPPSGFQQYIPKPFCSSGPLDWVRVDGPVSLLKTVTVTEAGRYDYRYELAGALTVTPVDITQSPPVPIGPSYPADVSERQRGRLGPHGTRVTAESKRLAHREGGIELFREVLALGPRHDLFRTQIRCLD